MRRTTSASLFVRGTLASGLLALSAQTIRAQTPVPVRELSPADAKTTGHFGNIFGLRALKDGGVLVNDGIRRQLVALDPTFTRRTVVIDSVAEGGQSYGPRASPLIPYLADSSLFVDGTSLSLLVLDPFGKVAHVMSAPKPSDLRFLASSASGVDAQGNLVYRAPMIMTRNASNVPSAPGAMAAPPPPPDSSAIVRANFETRMVDTVGRVKTQGGMRTNMTTGADGKMNIIMTINPLNTVDDWAVLSDGSLAFVRGHDYHIDWIKPDGRTFSSAKLPFDWKRLTDEDKQALIDSARTAQEKQMADNKAAAGTPGAAANAARAGAEVAAMSAMAGAVGGGGGGMEVRVVVAGPGGGGASGGPVMAFSSSGGPGGIQSMTPKIEFVPLKEIPDYYPAIRAGATKADLDGNHWILPTTSAQATSGELVYDVINNKGELFQRVRLPVGRSIAGFGHNGVVYLMYRDAELGWLLERTRILNNGRAAE
ncbi:MAG: hypothetical protein ABI120_07070 [Gemmatimonadaceae bacterium]